MSMGAVSVEQLPEALKQTLSRYVVVLADEIDAASSAAMKELVLLTKKEAPKKTGEFSRHIASKRIPGKLGRSSYLWYVKKPHADLGFILERGHLVFSHGKNTGVYTNRKINFVGRSLRQVRSRYEVRLQEIIKDVGKTMSITY